MLYDYTSDETVMQKVAFNMPARMLGKAMRKVLPNTVKRVLHLGTHKLNTPAPAGVPVKPSGTTINPGMGSSSDAYRPFGAHKPSGPNVYKPSDSIFEGRAASEASQRYSQADADFEAYLRDRLSGPKRVVRISDYFKDMPGSAPLPKRPVPTPPYAPSSAPTPSPSMPTPPEGGPTPPKFPKLPSLPALPKIPLPLAAGIGVGAWHLGDGYGQNKVNDQRDAEHQRSLDLIRAVQGTGPVGGMNTTQAQ